MDGHLSHLPMREGHAALAAQRALRNPQRIDVSTGVFARVSELAAAEPGRTAVWTSTGTMTYEQLCARVRQLRAALLAQGCGVQDRVAVVGQRSADTIASFLAIESIGATYLPVEPDWPAARVTDMLSRARPRCLLTDGAWEVGTGIPAICLPAVSGQLAQSPDPAPRLVPADEPRYIIHTSGSKGRPKGTIVVQRGLLNHLWSMVSLLRLTRDDTVAFTAPPAYVISVWQMLAVLLVGGTVAVVDEEAMRFGRFLAGTASHAGVTVLELVPTVIGWIVQEMRRRRTTADLTRLRCLVSTGEKLDPGLAADVLTCLPHVSFHNAYGATECSDDVSLHTIGPECAGQPRVPAGTPVPNVVLYLLVPADPLAPEDGVWRAAEPGESGELWVGGASVSGGYLNDPDLTRAAFFVDDLDPHSPTGRLYRTGDLAMFSDGLVHCLGRADRQVKIAGVRIELDEVEAVMSRVGGVVRCAAVAEHNNGQPELALYYVAQPQVRQEELYAPLRATLPAAMFPRRWVRMDLLPLNGNGKVDYRALAVARPSIAPPGLVGTAGREVRA